MSEATKPRFRIFKKLEKAIKYAAQLAIETEKSHCIWRLIEGSYVVVLKGFDPRKFPPFSNLPEKVETVSLVRATIILGKGR